ncbi:hypothetical protein PL8927_380097 [Planktothrix serta PCC 8927]|uniref:Uncharacterized protein n=1 Tax=Planktothrix serta PCC 8927 TaxID=671068 RepID=A0A7Z9DZK9_9CYAN|nr:hypothetical protein PL8927_380097 [Planktothrix serta PCC 8927]
MDGSTIAQQKLSIALSENPAKLKKTATTRHNLTPWDDTLWTIPDWCDSIDPC